MDAPLSKLLKRNLKIAIPAEALEYERMFPNFAAAGNELINNEYEIGIEIEVEKVGRNSVTLYPVWVTHQDNSLRNNGVEYVSIVMKGTRIVYALNQWFEIIGKHHFSPRTSIHIHINALDMSPKQIAGMLMVYCAFERRLYEWVGADRDKNNFCVPFYDANAYKLIKWFTPADGVFRLPSLEPYRYLGLNLDSIRKYGSLEFRHLPGTDDKQKIIHWINLIFCLKRYAMSHSFESIQEIISRINTTSDYLGLYNEVFKGVGGLNTVDLQRDMETQIASLKTIVFKNAFAEEIKNSFNVNDEWYSRLYIAAKPKKEFSWDVQIRRPQGVAIPVRGGQVRRNVEPVPENQGLDILLDAAERGFDVPVDMAMEDILQREREIVERNNDALRAFQPVFPNPNRRNH